MIFITLTILVISSHINEFTNKSTFREDKFMMCDIVPSSLS